MRQAMEQQIKVNESSDLLGDIVERLNEVVKHANASLKNSVVAMMMSEDNHMKANTTQVSSKRKGSVEPLELWI